MTEEATNIDEFEATGADEAPEAYEAPEAEKEAPERDFEAEAREMGWKPKDEWNGDPDQWRDAEEFVKRGEEIFSYVKRDRDREKDLRAREQKEFQDRIKRLEQANRKALEHQKAQYDAYVKQLEARQEQAVAEGDVDAFKALKEQREKLGPPPEIPEERHEAPPVDASVESWASQNPWFFTDDAARIVAINEAGKVASAGGTVEAQVNAAEAAVRKRFPEHFNAPRQAVETGGQAPRQGKKQKGVSNLPREAREAFDQFVRMGVYKKEDLPKYAQSYWEQE